MAERSKRKEEDPVKVVLKLETKAICLCAILWNILWEHSKMYLQDTFTSETVERDSDARWSIKRTC